MGINRDGQTPDGYQGVNPVQRPANIRAQRAPTSSDRRYKKGAMWVDESANNVYVLTSVSSGSANWEILGGPSVAVSSLDGDSGSASPSSGVVTLATGAGLTSVASGSTVTTSLDAEILRYAETTMTATEVKALATTPIELVAAPGAGLCVEFCSALLKLVAGSEVLAEAGDNLGIKYTDASGVQVSATIESTGFIDQAANTYTNAIAAGDAIVAATGCENQALVLDNLGSNFTGNASDDAQLVVGVAYRIHSL